MNPSKSWKRAKKSDTHIVELAKQHQGDYGSRVDMVSISEETEMATQSVERNIGHSRLPSIRTLTILQVFSMPRTCLHPAPFHLNRPPLPRLHARHTSCPKASPFQTF